MNRRFYLLILSTACSLFCGVSIADNTPQIVRTDVYRLAHQGDSLLVDMDIDLAPIRLAPDCSLFLLPTLYRGADSLNLAPVLLNGPQSDRMYRRRKALGLESEIEKVTPYLILREGEHALPRINYQVAVPYQAWMDSVDIKLSTIYCNCDKRISRIDMRTFRNPTLVRTLVADEKITVHDTLYITKVEPAPVDSLLLEREQSVAVGEAAAAAAGEAAGEAAAAAAAVGEEGQEFTIYFRRWWYRGWKVDRDILVAMDSYMLSPGAEKKISVLAYTSPEGSYKANRKLALKRALELREFLEERFGADHVQVTIQTFPRGWEPLTQLIANSQMIGKEAVLDIIRQTDDLQEREERLQSLNSGSVYNYMSRELFPQLRKVVIRVTK